MATQEHLVLSSLIKSVHQDLRFRSRLIGSEMAWVEHCEKKEVLKEYAAAMYKLATEHWEIKTGDEINSRIEWVVKQCKSYFIDGGIENCHSKELLKIHRIKYFKEQGERFFKSIEANETVNFNCPLVMLDVGSCYNPFKKFSLFTTFPIDLAPATEDVFPCDFLDVKVSERKNANENDDRKFYNFLKNKNCASSANELRDVKCMPAEFFDVINFSLFLEYLPSAEQRYASCQKAYDLLKPGGLLFIITPDSKHQSANAPIMRNWRIALETIGFLRITYQKLTHLHCMAYRKCPFPALPKTFSEKELSQFEKSSKLLPLNMMMIPQDFSVCKNECEEDECSSQENLNAENVNYFIELPMAF